MYSVSCIECSNFSCVDLNNRHLCGTCLEELRKRLKSPRLGAEILKGGGALRNENNANYWRSINCSVRRTGVNARSN